MGRNFLHCPWSVSCPWEHLISCSATRADRLSNGSPSGGWRASWSRYCNSLFSISDITSSSCIQYLQQSNEMYQAENTNSRYQTCFQADTRALKKMSSTDQSSDDDDAGYGCRIGRLGGSSVSSRQRTRHSVQVSQHSTTLSESSNPNHKTVKLGSQNLIGWYYRGSNIIEKQWVRDP